MFFLTLRLREYPRDYSLNTNSLLTDTHYVFSKLLSVEYGITV